MGLVLGCAIYLRSTYFILELDLQLQNLILIISLLDFKIRVVFQKVILSEQNKNAAISFLCSSYRCYKFTTSLHLLKSGNKLSFKHTYAKVSSGHESVQYND